MKTIRKGSMNAEDVVMLQEMLKLAGYPVAVDGVFGDATDKAVRAYQRTSGLVVDGVVGEQTWLKLMGQVPEYAEERSDKFLTERDLIRASEELVRSSSLVRYSVAAVYVDDAGFDRKLVDQLTAEHGGKIVHQDGSPGTA